MKNVKFCSSYFGLFYVLRSLHEQGVVLKIKELSLVCIITTEKYLWLGIDKQTKNNKYMVTGGEGGGGGGARGDTFRAAYAYE